VAERTPLPLKAGDFIGECGAILWAEEGLGRLSASPCVAGGARNGSVIFIPSVVSDLPLRWPPTACTGGGLRDSEPQCSATVIQGAC
jgi:hypothetical protein